MNKAIKYRLYPTDEQKIMFAKTFGCCRKVYNLMLADKIACYEETKSFGKQTPAMYKSDYPFLKEVDSLALANVQLNLQGALRNCFDKKRKVRNGFPKFKSATVSQDSDGKYYVSIIFTFDKVITNIAVSDNALGLDYASDGLYTDSNGNKGTNHKYYRESHDKLAKAQRKLSRMKGSGKREAKSNNYIKQLRKVNKIHKHIANQRLDNLHKISTEIANQYDVVCVESLNMRAMSNKGFGNGKATLDNGYGMFLNMLDYKLADRGKYFIKVDKWFPSSQICNRCGTVHAEMKNLSIRKMRCDCGFVLDRDHNAALNIKNEGLRILRAVS